MFDGSSAFRGPTRALRNLRSVCALDSDASRRTSDPRERLGAMVSGSAAMRRVHRLIARVAGTDAPVLVSGESGTGKELVARTIHSSGRRRTRPFLAVNCGALSSGLIESELFGHERGSFTGATRGRRGYFERANRGTLFLDEITEMPLELQVKLLRVLESGTVTRVGATEELQVDVRILAASNRDPLAAVATKTLREDLFYRLNVFPIQLPPLRERGKDVTLLAQHFLDRLNARDGGAKRFTPRALEVIQSSAWPGNVRELMNAVECAAILADDLIDVDDLPPPRVASRASGCEQGTLRVAIGSTLAEVERQVILGMLEAHSGNKARTADTLGISLKTLYNRLNVYQGHGQNELPLRRD
ncbi:MAG TPA: sigma-54 dependent transcriptional regulator [Myxococcota bacterium]|nr:sigma-54 dependent transcriptional regulator [Myxococcota bacterium]